MVGGGVVTSALSFMREKVMQDLEKERKKDHYTMHMSIKYRMRSKGVELFRDCKISREFL